MSSPARHGILLAMLVSCWAISWPIIKVGVAVVPPVWFASLRFAIATLCLFAVAALRGEIVVPVRRDWPLILLSSLFQMAAYAALTSHALTILPPGRASVLAYSTPLWVAPLAAWWLRERITMRSISGIALGTLGMLSIAIPSLHAGSREGLHAYGALLLAAIGWAVSIVAIRAHTFRTSSLALAPWQTLVAAGLLLPIAWTSEGRLPAIDATGASSLLFVGCIATAFGYWAVVEAGRHFSANTLSIALLATPPLGILASSIALGEPVDRSLVLGGLAILAGILVVLPRRNAHADAGPSDRGTQ